MSNVDEIISLVLKEPKQDGADFSGFDLKGVSLNGASFVFATLLDVVMEDAELREIDFSQASLDKSSFKNAKIKGEAFFDNKLLFNQSNYHTAKFRGHEIGMIFQDPMTSLNPYLTIEEQLGLVL
ncbi:MAG: pentapeptide repeat-containing protein, partial [Nitrospinota bacterium]